MSIIVKNLQKSFDNKRIFDGFSYTFDEKSIYIIEGESGIGKTTLLRLISGLDTSYEGEISGGGLDRCAFMFQEYRLFPTISALENVLLSCPSEQRKVEQARELLFRLGFKEEEMQLLPEMLSGGMKQRVSFARAVFSQRPILLLDEPTKELDTTNADVMLKLIKELGREKTVILVSHNKAEHILDSAITIKL